MMNRRLVIDKAEARRLDCVWQVDNTKPEQRKRTVPLLTDELIRRLYYQETTV